MPRDIHHYVARHISNRQQKWCKYHGVLTPAKLHSSSGLHCGFQTTLGDEASACTEPVYDIEVLDMVPFDLSDDQRFAEIVVQAIQEAQAQPRG